MKKIILTLVAVFTLGIFSASAQKMAHIDYLKVMDTLTTYKTAIKKSEEVEASTQESAQFLQQKIQEKYLEYQNLPVDASAMERQLLEEEVTRLQERLQGMEQQYQQQLQVIQERYFVPLEKWLKEAVSKVGESKGLDYILYYDQENSIFWVNPNKGVDLTKEVITEMLKLEAADPVLEPGE